MNEFSIPWSASIQHYNYVSNRMTTKIKKIKFEIYIDNTKVNKGISGKSERSFQTHCYSIQFNITFTLSTSFVRLDNRFSRMESKFYRNNSFICNTYMKSGQFRVLVGRRTSSGKSNQTSIQSLSLVLICLLSFPPLKMKKNEKKIVNFSFAVENR